MGAKADLIRFARQLDLPTHGYKAPLAEHGKYNRFIRDYFADVENHGKSLADAAAAWNPIKHKRGDPRYESSKK